jgi:Flp pilus assembly pilin Flp
MTLPARVAQLVDRDRMATVLTALLDESGQDVVEYALLSAIVGIASILTWQALVTSVGNAYSGADADVQSLSACTPDPGGGGCP